MQVWAGLEESKEEPKAAAPVLKAGTCRWAGVKAMAEKRGKKGGEGQR